MSDMFGNKQPTDEEHADMIKRGVITMETDEIRPAPQWSPETDGYVLACFHYVSPLFSREEVDSYSAVLRLTGHCSGHHRIMFVTSQQQRSMKWRREERLYGPTDDDQ